MRLSVVHLLYLFLLMDFRNLQIPLYSMMCCLLLNRTKNCRRLLFCFCLNFSGWYCGILPNFVFFKCLRLFWLIIYTYFWFKCICGKSVVMRGSFLYVIHRIRLMRVCVICMDAVIRIVWCFFSLKRAVIFLTRRNWWHQGILSIFLKIILIIIQIICRLEHT